MSRSSAMTMAARAMRLLGASSQPSILRQCLQSPAADLRRHLFSNPSSPPHRIPAAIQSRSFRTARRDHPFLRGSDSDSDSEDSDYFSSDDDDAAFEDGNNDEDVDSDDLDDYFDEEIYDRRSKTMENKKSPKN
ncbi:hypothetical protein Scep_011309 [Stephania cephalantha]|uniref:Uncharacterized protein n=1 Tax=Stephania cephalantha TaxID=152367 RepID=A0AAP0JCU8_9MAGN